MLEAARDIDYDPAAEDEDGVPIFSEETREQAARERATCSECGARTYRAEECVCEEGGDAEVYEEVLAERPTDDPRYTRGAH